MLAEKYIRSADYDAINDILYLAIEGENQSNSYGDDVDKGITLMRDMDTDRITGLLIFYPLSKCEDREMRLKDLGFNFSLRQYLPS